MCLLWLQLGLCLSSCPFLVLPRGHQNSKFPFWVFFFFLRVWKHSLIISSQSTAKPAQALHHKVLLLSCKGAPPWCRLKQPAPTCISLAPCLLLQFTHEEPKAGGVGKSTSNCICLLLPVEAGRWRAMLEGACSHHLPTVWLLGFYHPRLCEPQHHLPSRTLPPCTSPLPFFTLLTPPLPPPRKLLFSGS